MAEDDTARVLEEEMAKGAFKGLTEKVPVLGWGYRVLVEKYYLDYLYTDIIVGGLKGPIADNVSANVIGLGLGTLFRFWSYRRWVFPEDADSADEAAISTVA